MTFFEYPKAKYHVDGRNCIVNNLEEELALDLHEWFDHPAKAKEGYKPPAPTLEEKLEHEDYLAENPKPMPELVGVKYRSQPLRRKQL